MDDKITLPKGSRNRFYYVIMIPLDNFGHGPCSIEQAIEVKYEVWDQFCNDYGSYEFLPDAIDLAERLNEGHSEWENKDR